MSPPAAAVVASGEAEEKVEEVEEVEEGKGSCPAMVAKEMKCAASSWSVRARLASTDSGTGTPWPYVITKQSIQRS